VLRGQTIEVWGDGNQTKDYIFADDLVKIIFLLLKSNYLNKIINVGSGQKYQLNGILDTIKRYLPKIEVKYVDSNSIDVKDFCLDISLLKSLIEIEFTEFEDAIEKTISWEKNKLKF
jgi:UDP-glucose 4-epimerase